MDDSDFQPTNPCKGMMREMRGRYGKSLSWGAGLDQELAIISSAMPTPVDLPSKKKLVQVLGSLKVCLEDRGFSAEEVAWLDERVKLYEGNTQIDEHIEPDGTLKPSVHEGLANINFDKEGVFLIDNPYNYKQLSNITNDIYNLVLKTRSLEQAQFYISKNITINGQIGAENFDTPKELAVVKIWEKKKKNALDVKERRTTNFGDPLPNKAKWNFKRDLTTKMWIYQFVSEHKQEFLVFSNKRMKIGDYEITGVVTKIGDFKNITDSIKTMLKMPVLFVHSFKSKVIQFQNHEEFKRKLSEWDVNHENWFETPFLLEENHEQYILEHPRWFKEMLWAWLLHSGKGLGNKYPAHLLLVAPPNAGKSFLLNSLYRVSQEIRPPFDGAGSTLKLLVPSFKSQPVQLGYLAWANRFAFVDEFLRITLRSGTKELMNETLATMNNLLEHQERIIGSGMGTAKVNMTSRLIAGTNPPAGCTDVTGLLTKVDHSFLSRQLIYWVTDAHREMITGHDQEFRVQKFKVNLDHFIAIVDYLHSFEATIDLKELNKIFESVKKVLNPSLLDHYNSRHRHHLTCLLDGIVKKRCMMTHDVGFTAKKVDYDLLKFVWTNIVGSWMPREEIKGLPVAYRKSRMPEDSINLFEEVALLKRPVSNSELKEIGMKLIGRTYINAYIILRENKLLIEMDGLIYPYFLINEEVEEE